MNVYDSCPCFITPRFTLRRTEMADAPGLLSVYSDPAAQSCFNADNCTSDFRYQTLEEMTRCVSMWVWSYTHGYFVRWTIFCQETPIGTVEMFRRDDGEDGLGCGVLRLDLHSAYEFSDVIEELLRALLPELHSLFGCASILTKAKPHMARRRLALAVHGFTPWSGVLTGHDGAAYGDYWIRRHTGA